MIEYPKIQSVFKRSEKTHRFIEGNWALPEFEYLQNNEWIWTEKIDGTNIRIIWTAENPVTITFAGRTANAQMPTFLLQRLQELFPVHKFEDLSALCLYGEGYGAKIQKGGGNYKSDGVDFILFDILIDGWWLKRDDIEGIANQLGISVVPIVGRGTIYEGIDLIKSGLESTFGSFMAEGIVLKPSVELKARNGKRIITKMKHKDFEIK